MTTIWCRSAEDSLRDAAKDLVHRCVRRRFRGHFFRAFPAVCRTGLRRQRPCARFSPESARRPPWALRSVFLLFSSRCVVDAHRGRWQTLQFYCERGRTKRREDGKKART